MIIIIGKIKYCWKDGTNTLYECDVHTRGSVDDEGEEGEPGRDGRYSFKRRLNCKCLKLRI